NANSASCPRQEMRGEAIKPDAPAPRVATKERRETAMTGSQLRRGGAIIALSGALGNARPLHNAFRPYTPCHKPDSTIYGRRGNGGSVLNPIRLIALVLTAACASAKSTATTSSSAAQPVTRAESD